MVTDARRDTFVEPGWWVEERHRAHRWCIVTRYSGEWAKGVYEVNLVDEVTQYEFVAAVEGISERFLVPALEALIEAFPFEIKGFHADNGSEYINYRVARLLRKLHVEEFTKSRPHRSNDNALVESKNASVVRRHLGHAHIARRHAALVNGFLRDVLAPYLNYHRPCHFPVETTDSKGRTRKRYPFENVTTPYLKLKSLQTARGDRRAAARGRTLGSPTHRGKPASGCACVRLSPPNVTDRR